MQPAYDVQAGRDAAMVPLAPELQRALGETLTRVGSLALAILEGPALRLKWANPRFLRLLNIHRAEGELTSLTLEQLLTITQGSADSLVSACRQVFDTHKSCEGLVCRVQGQRQETAWCRFSIAPLSLPEGPTDLLLIGCEFVQAEEIEEALRASEERFRTLAEFTYDWEYWRAVDGTLVYVTPSCERITGYRTEQFYADPGLLEAIVHPDDRAVFAAHLHGEHCGHQPLSLEYRILAADGQQRWIEHVCQEVRGRNGAPLGRRASNRDVTDRKQVEQQLQASEARARRLFESNIIGVYFADFEGHIFDANDAFLAIVGYDRKDLGGKLNWRDLTPPEYREIDERVVGELKRTGAYPPFEKAYFRKDGTRVPILLGLALLPGDREAVAFVIDLTERKRMENALRETNERLCLVLEAAGMGTFDWDVRTGEGFWTAQAEQIFGYEPGAPRRTLEDCSRRIHPEDRPRVEASRQKCMEERKPCACEYRVVWPDGTIRWVAAYGRFYYDDEGRPVRMLGIVTDITERKQAEAQLKALNETLEQRVAERTAEAERRAAQLRVLAAELTLTEQRERRRLAHLLHDHLQQLLVAARIKIDRLRRRLEDEGLRRFAEQADQLLNESLSASRTLTLELSTPVLYDAGLTAALEWLGRQIEEKHGLPVEVRVDPNAEPGTEDIRVLLFQAVRELLFNVVKHASAPSAEVSMTMPDEQHLQIEVCDEGVGFDPLKLEPGQDHAGGFGLFSLRERLELLGGRLEIDSVPGRGTRVKILAPRHGQGGDEASPPAAPVVAEVLTEKTTSPPRSASEEPRKIRVLLADDHPVLRMGLVELLMQEPDIEVVGEASDGEEAIELVRRVEPDVVLMDVTMPRLDGIEATQRLVAELPHVRVIGLSMHEEDDLATAMRAAGAVDYVSKSGPTSTILTAIRRSSFARKEGKSP